MAVAFGELMEVPAMGTVGALRQYATKRGLMRVDH